MATESSAVVRFISLAQQSKNPVLPTQPPPAPITSEFGTEVLREVRSRPSRAPLIVGAIALAGGAAAGGLYLGKNGVGGPDGPDKASAPAAAATPVAAAERAETRPAAQPAPVATPQVTAAPVVTVPPDVLAETGFDIRVEPAASITLDGSLLGKAPLRVRNLQAGAHVLDIEAPAGYFSRRMEVTLAAGEARELKLVLDKIEEDPAVAAATADDQASARPARKSRAELRRDRKERARQEVARKKEMRATRAAAARAARANKTDSKPKVVAEPLPATEAKPAAKSDKESAADAELEAAMADIVGKPASKKSAASAAGASSLSASPSSSSSSSEKGNLMLGSKPPCDIILDGRPTGLKTPQRAMELAPGTHSVVLVNAELGIEKKFKVRIAPGKTTKAIQDLTSKLD